MLKFDHTKLNNRIFKTLLQTNYKRSSTLDSLFTMNQAKTVTQKQNILLVVLVVFVILHYRKKPHAQYIYVSLSREGNNKISHYSSKKDNYPPITTQKYTKQINSKRKDIFLVVNISLSILDIF